MRSETRTLIVLTGGPSAGKTTLITALAKRGHAVQPEAGRAIIRDQEAIGGEALPWKNRALFAELMLAADLRGYHTASRQDGLVFFDRGLPDIAGYLMLCGLPVPPYVEAAAERFRYNRTVFIAPPWPAIFGQDAERKQDFAEAVRTYEAMVRTYRRYGYDLVELPQDSAESRVGFILRRLGAAR